MQGNQAHNFKLSLLTKYINQVRFSNIICANNQCFRLKNNGFITKVPKTLIDVEEIFRPIWKSADQLP